MRLIDGGFKPRCSRGTYNTGRRTLDAKLYRWQHQDGVVLMPEIPTQMLFAQWAEEDARMTDAEREAEDRLWKDMEKELAANNGLELRRLGQ